MGKLSKDQKGDHGPEKTGKKNVGKHSSSSTPTSGGGNSANSCISTGSAGSSTPNTPGYVPISGGSLRSSSCTSSKFRRSTSRSDLQSINSIDLSESSDRNEQSSSAENSSRYSTSHTACDNDEMHYGQALDDEEEEEEADEESRSEQQAETPIATLQLPVVQEAVFNPIYSMPTIAAPPENRSMLCAITEREDEDSCDMDTDCSGVNAFLNCYPEFYSSFVSCGGSTSCAAASGGFGHVMRPTAANFLRFFSQERQRSQLIEMSMNILQPNNQVRESVYEGDVEVNTISYYPLPPNYDAQSHSQPQRPNHIIQFADDWHEDRTAQSNMEITGGSELRWMQYVEPNQFTGNIQERLVLKSSDGIHAYDADFGFKLVVSRMTEKDGPQGRKYYEVTNDVTATASIFVIRKQQHMVNGKFSGTFISPDYNVCPYSVNHTAYSKYHALYCEDEPRYCFGMISSIKPVLTRVMGQIVHDVRPSAGNNPSADGLRVGNGNWFQRDILKLQAFGADGMANLPIYLDVYYGIALNTFGEFIQQNSLGEVYRGFRFKLIYPSMQGETVKVSQSSENGGAPQELVLKLIHHHIASDIAHDASAADASLTPQEVENSLASDLLERNENFVQEIRVMTFLDLVTRPKHSNKVKIGQAGGMLPNYRHTITDMIPDLDLSEHPDYEQIPTFHRHHTLTRAHGRFLLFASDCYHHKCLLKFTQSYRQQFYFTELEVLYVFRQVLCSLVVMHHHGIAHQDISSENVLLKAIHHSGPIVIRRDEPHPLLSMLCILMDYGQAFAVPYTMDEAGNIEYNTKVPVNTTKRQPVGKFAFHAPELIAIFSKLKAWKDSHGIHMQLDDEQKTQLVYDPFAVDVFQLGIFLFIMIFRIYPFTTRGSVERSQRQFFESLKDKTFFTLSIPQMIESYQVPKPSIECLDLLQRLLAVNPEERPRVGQIIMHPWVQQHRPELPSPPILITNPSLLYTMHLEPTPPLPLQMSIPFSSNFFEGGDLHAINTSGPQNAVDEA